MPPNTGVNDFLKKILRWLWPILFIIILSYFQKSALLSAPLVQLQEGMLLYAGYLLFIIPMGILFSKAELFADESKLALILACGTYIFFDYVGIFSTWENFAKRWVYLYLFNMQHTVFILTVAFCGIGLMWLQTHMNQDKKNRQILMFTTFVLSAVPCIDLLRTPIYNFGSDLFSVQESPGAVNQQAIPKRIFWIILDEHPSSLVLNELWGYKDTIFRSGLESLGFTVYDSCVSNYNSTPFSISATTYGAMLPISGQQVLSYRQWFALGERIRQSPVLVFLRNHGYETHILSFLGADYKKMFIADQGKIVTYHGEIIGTSALGVLLSHFENLESVSMGFYNMEIVDSLHTLLHSLPNNNQQIFTYAHLLMPHGPYLTLEKKTTQTKDQYFELYNEQAYLSHVRYTDSVILDLFHAGLDSLSPDQRTNTMVILQSDHGPRYLQKGEKDLRWRSSFGILNAVLWPKYSNGKFYNGMSSVNTFRILLRDYWGIDLGTVKDSSENVSPLIESKNE